MRIGARQDVLCTSRPHAQRQPRAFALKLLKGQPGKRRISGRNLSGRIHPGGNPLLRDIGEILVGNRMKQHPHGTGFGIATNNRINPVSSIGGIDPWRRWPRNLDGTFDARDPAGLIGPDIGHQALAVRCISNAEWRPVTTTAADDFWLRSNRQCTRPLR